MVYMENNYDNNQYSNNNNNNATAKFSNNASALNEQYFREMDNNSKLFEMKMKRLSRYQQPDPNKDIKEVPRSTPKKNQIDLIQDHDRNRDREDQFNDQPMSQSDQKVIESLKNEIQYKDSLIAELRGQLDQEKNLSGSMKDIPLYEKEIDSLNSEATKRIGEITALKEDNENLKLKIDNLKLENVSIKQNKDRQINHTENLTIELSETKDELGLLRKKVGENEKINKNLKKEYELIIQKMTAIKKENSNIKAEIEELKADNYNLTQENNELRKKAGNNKQYQPKQQQMSSASSITTMNQQEFGSKGIMIDSSPSNTSTNYNQNRAVRSNYGMQQQQQQQQSSQMIEQSQGDGNDCSPYDNNYGYFPSEKKIKETKNEMNSLDLQLNAWLKEKNLIENDLSRLPERPRTLNEIKAKKEKNDKLKEIDDRINEIKTRIRQLNN